VERSISQAIVSGFSQKLMDSLDIDVAIAGAGPSGLVCAFRLAQSGRNVAIFESSLGPGGGMWGGGMMFNEIVLQKNVVSMLEEFGIRYESRESGLVSVDSVEASAALIYRAVNAGTKLFNCVTVEDVVYKEDRIGGVVVNWTPVRLQGMHVDPLVVISRAVLDATGHDAALTARAAGKAGIRLDTPTGGVAGEKPMSAEEGEIATVANTREVYPGLFVSGMAANAVFGSARMGPIFGGMLRSGERAAEIIAAALSGNPGAGDGR
jgi:thiazole biosynthesis enzyme